MKPFSLRLLPAFFLPFAVEGHSQSFPHQPKDATVLVNHDFSTRCPPPLACSYGGGTIVADGDPASPYSLEHTWVNHNAPNVAQPYYNFGGVDNFYMAFYWKPSNPFYGWAGNSGQKIALIEDDHTYISMTSPRGCPGGCGPYHMVIAMSIAHDNRHIGTNGWGEPVCCGNNVADPPVPLGQWNLIEIQAKTSSTPASKNGIFRMWMNGQQLANHTNVNFNNRTFSTVYLTSIWDQLDSQRVTDWHRYGHLRITTGGSGTGGTVPPPPPPPPTTPPPPPAAAPGTVMDLAAGQIGSTSLTLSFSQVSDGLGNPAKYGIRFSDNGSLWGGAPEVSEGTCKAPLQGTAVSGSLSCTVAGLKPATPYQFQLVAYRGTPNVDAVFGGLSNVVSASTLPAARSTDVNGDGATTVADVQLAINQSLGIAACGSGDVDGDGACDITDVQRVVNAALGL